MLNESNNAAQGDVPESVGQTSANAESKVLKIEILHLVKGAQQQHGLRHGDYQRYRGYCTRRIRRLRKTLKFPQADKKHFKKREVTLNQINGKGAPDKRFVFIPLFSAERAWAYAMQLKPEANTEPRKRFHLISKLKKASKYALHLQELCNSNIFDARTKLECEAYVAWMYGTLHFEMQLWTTAGEYLKRAEVVYENLAKALPDDEQELYRAKISEFTPNLRFCAYNISGSGATADDLLEMRAQGLLEDLDVLINQTKTESSESLQTIDWRGRKITVRPEKVNFFLLSIQDLDKSLEKCIKIDDKIKLIERTLIDCKDAIQAVRDEIRQDPKLRSLTTGQTASGIQYLLAYLSYIRHSRTLQRNLLLVEQAKENFDDPNCKTQLVKDSKRVRAQDLARLYEIILQNISEMQQINGMENNTTYQEEIKCLALAYKAFRCYYIALTLIDIRKWKEAVALYERASNYALEAMSHGNHNLDEKILEQLKALISTIDGCKFSAHACSVLENDNTEDSVYVSKLAKSSKSLYERLSQYKEDQSLLTKNPNVFKMVPEMEAIPCKPLFFDLALNHVNFPSLDAKLQAGTKKGISGFVKGFLGWSDNN